MSNKISIQISGSPEAVSGFLTSLKQPEQKQPTWVTATPWFERYGKLTPEEAADLEASTYGNGLHLEDWQMSAVKRIYGPDAMTVPVKFFAGKFVR